MSEKNTAQHSEFAKAYDQSAETGLYTQWSDSGYFNPDKLPGKRSESFSIVMPPPNATGVLHVGHAVMLALQDIMIRFERMRGKETLWVPGTDHAAIATQNVVEKELKEKGKSKLDLGREEFLKRVDDFVSTKRGRITEQVERMGASCDWTREHFTLEEGMTEAVTKAFRIFYEDGLIYRGTRVINWCPRCQSTLADDEVEYKEQDTVLYTFRYDKNFPFAIASTRPETKFGDTAVAVHPDDPRYQKFIGKEFDITFASLTRRIKVVADRGIDMEYGTGALGVTPAHSKTDEAIALREHLPSITVIDERGKMTSEAGEQYAGISAKQARAKIVEYLKQEGLMESEEPIKHNLSICYRCGTAIEPRASKQWFIAVDRPTKRLGGKSLKQRALQVIEQDEIRFIPDRFASTYKQWMENLHDWCISRQIWYGHRIPVWYKGDEIAVAEKTPGKGWEQDADTLDTWFSSGLWTFSTLGWPSSANDTDGKPKGSSDLQRFHPTTVMETGYDIIFFWVARMILMSTYLLGEIPFRTVYLHGLVRDAKGRKMSKSLGNGIDPLEMANKYGADAVRLALTIGTTPGNDQKLDEQKIKGYRNYVNKIWNIGRFLAMQESESAQSGTEPSLADRWITSRLNTLIQSTTSTLEHFEFSQAGESVYEFAWHEFADWYIEIAKVEGNTKMARNTFKIILQLLHPIMPFVTERLWSELEFDKELLMIQDWPIADTQAINPDAEQQFAQLKDYIAGLRRTRQEKGIGVKEILDVPTPTEDLLKNHQMIVERLGRVRFV